MHVNANPKKVAPSVVLRSREIAGSAATTGMLELLSWVGEVVVMEEIVVMEERREKEQ